MPLGAPSTVDWTAEPPVTDLIAGRRYTVSRDRMSDLVFKPGWFTQAPFNIPGTVITGEGPQDVMDRVKWRQYVTDICD